MKISRHNFQLKTRPSEAFPLLELSPRSDLSSTSLSSISSSCFETTSSLEAASNAESWPRGFYQRWRDTFGQRTSPPGFSTETAETRCETSGSACSRTEMCGNTSAAGWVRSRMRLGWRGLSCDLSQNTHQTLNLRSVTRGLGARALVIESAVILKQLTQVKQNKMGRHDWCSYYDKVGLGINTKRNNWIENKAINFLTRDLSFLGQWEKRFAHGRERPSWSTIAHRYRCALWWHTKTKGCGIELGFEVPFGQILCPSSGHCERLLQIVPELRQADKICSLIVTPSCLLFGRETSIKPGRAGISWFFPSINLYFKGINKRVGKQLTIRESWQCI